jgi:hypothetical protein
VRTVGEIAGGPDQIHLALKSALTSEGTLLMYASCPRYYDEVGRGNLTTEQEREIREKLAGIRSCHGKVGSRQWDTGRVFVGLLVLNVKRRHRANVRQRLPEVMQIKVISEEFTDRRLLRKRKQLRNKMRPGATARKERN